MLRGRRAARLHFTTGNQIELFDTGRTYFAALIEQIDAAVHDVCVETYIFCDDAGGRPVADAMMRAASRGVRVRLVTDGIGTARLPLFTELAAAGVEHRIYNPHLFGRFGISRTHRKLAAIDAAVGFCGGINLVDDLDAAGIPLAAPRWDFAVRLAGPVVADLLATFEAQWRRLAANRPVAGVGRRPRNAKPPPLPRESAVAFVARDNFRNRRAIERAYLYAIALARSEILVANPYFVPGARLRRALKGAARRGVDVRLLVGRKEFVALDFAVPYLYGSLLEAGVRIAEYDKTLLHGKVAVMDSNWGTVGSSNLDALSLLLNHEANVVMVHDAAVGRLRAAILAAFDESRSIDQVHYAARPRAARFVNWCAYMSYRFAMKVLTIGQYD